MVPTAEPEAEFLAGCLCTSSLSSTCTFDDALPLASPYVAADKQTEEQAETGISSSFDSSTRGVASGDDCALESASTSTVTTSSVDNGSGLEGQRSMECFLETAFILPEAFGYLCRQKPG